MEDPVPLSLDSLSGVNFDSRQNHLNQGRIGGFPLGLVEAGRKKNIKNTSSKKKDIFHEIQLSHRLDMKCMYTI